MSWRITRFRHTGAIDVDLYFYGRVYFFSFGIRHICNFVKIFFKRMILYINTLITRLIEFYFYFSYHIHSNVREVLLKLEFLNNSMMDINKILKWHAG
jgi:hypothetical protein